MEAGLNQFWFDSFPGINKGIDCYHKIKGLHDLLNLFVILHVGTVLYLYGLPVSTLNRPDYTLVEWLYLGCCVRWKKLYGDIRVLINDVGRGIVN